MISDGQRRGDTADEITKKGQQQQKKEDQLQGHNSSCKESIDCSLCIH